MSGWDGRPPTARPGVRVADQSSIPMRRRGAYAAGLLALAAVGGYMLHRPPSPAAEAAELPPTCHRIVCAIARQRDIGRRPVPQGATGCELDRSGLREHGRWSPPSSTRGTARPSSSPRAHFASSFPPGSSRISGGRPPDRRSRFRLDAPTSFAARYATPAMVRLGTGVLAPCSLNPRRYGACAGVGLRSVYPGPRRLVLGVFEEAVAFAGISAGGATGPARRVDDDDARG